MRLHPDDSPRLSQRRDQPNLAERIAGQALRDLPPPVPLSPSALARIAASVDARNVPDRRPVRLGWVLAAAAFLLGLATAASAAHLELLPAWLSRLVQDRPKLASQQHASPRVSPTGAKPHAGLVGERPSSFEPSTSQPSAVALAPATVEATADRGAPALAPTLPAAKSLVGDSERKQSTGQHAGRPRREAGDAESGEGATQPHPPALAMRADGPRPLPAASETPVFLAPPQPAPSAAAPLPSAVPPVPTTVAPQPAMEPVAPHPASANQTAKHLKDVIQALRVEHSPKSALTLLDRHAAEFSSSAFGEEVLLLRVEAMLALGRRGEVLRLLDGTSLTSMVASQALLVTRGELRAAVNRCSESIGDFDLVIAVARRPPKQALLGRASCRGKLGDEAGAKADLDRLRREYPDAPSPPSPRARH